MVKQNANATYYAAASYTTEVRSTDWSKQWIENQEHISALVRINDIIVIL